MFSHNFKYTLKILLKNKILLFWTFAFPILLGTFFHMAFSNIENSEKLKIIKIAIINNENYQKEELFKNTFTHLSDKKNKDRLFSVTYTNIEKAKKLLEEKKITGYLIFEKENIKIKVNENGINETILKNIVDEINCNQDIIKTLLNKNIHYQKIQNIITQNEVKLNNITSKNLSYTMIEYYTLIAMTCLYGGILSMFITNYKLANTSSVGKRTSISPIHKLKMLLASLLASYIVQIIGIAILFMYTIFVLKVNYSSPIPYIILLALLGSLAGLSLGISIATLIKKDENTKTGILISITMLGCFLSGMMGITMKYIIDKNIPILNKINPANMITDGFYSLYYYDTLNRYVLNIVSLLLFSICMILLSYKGLRRQKYDSI